MPCDAVKLNIGVIGDADCKYCIEGKEIDFCKISLSYLFLPLNLFIQFVATFGCFLRNYLSVS